jgi:hypothetical protein
MFDWIDFELMILLFAKDDLIFVVVLSELDLIEPDI